MYSSVKVNGKKLYEYARKNIEVERPERTVNIKEIQRTSDLTFDQGGCQFDSPISVASVLIYVPFPQVTKISN